MPRPKAWLRAKLAPTSWMKLRSLRRRTRSRLAGSVARVLAAGMRILPVAVIVRVRERLTLTRPLDYPRARLLMTVTSPTEWEVRLKSCGKEPETVDWLESTFTAGDVFYDVGANVGAYSLLAAEVSGRAGVVYAFEPGPATYASLVENVRLNDLASVVTPLPVAVGDVTGMVAFGLHSSESGDASHVGLVVDSTGESVQVLSLRLDDVVAVLGAQPPTHLKIDVDGGESLVLAGALSTLASPTLRSVLVEVEEGRSDINSIRKVICDSGFDLQADVTHFGSPTHNWIFGRASGWAAPTAVR